MDKYVLVKSCDTTIHTQSWYRNKIGYGFKVHDIRQGIYGLTDEYLIKLKDKWCLINFSDAEIFIPTRFEKIKIKLGIRILTDFQLDIEKYNL